MQQFVGKTSCGKIQVGNNLPFFAYIHLAKRPSSDFFRACGNIIAAPHSFDSSPLPPARMEDTLNRKTRVPIPKVAKAAGIKSNVRLVPFLKSFTCAAPDSCSRSLSAWSIPSNTRFCLLGRVFQSTHSCNMQFGVSFAPFVRGIFDGWDPVAPRAGVVIMDSHAPTVDRKCCDADEA